METMNIDAYRALLDRQAEEEKRGKSRRRTEHTESNLQRQCVEWFRRQYRSHAMMLFAVPNGGGRSKVEAGIMKAEGVTAGVSDLILLEARGSYGALCIEMKTKKRGSRQEKSQKEWQAVAEEFGNKYVIVRSLEEFMKVVKSYMDEPLSHGRVIIRGMDPTLTIIDERRSYGRLLEELL